MLPSFPLWLQCSVPWFAAERRETIAESKLRSGCERHCIRRTRAALVRHWQALVSVRLFGMLFLSLTAVAGTRFTKSKSRANSKLLRILTPMRRQLRKQRGQQSRAVKQTPLAMQTAELVFTAAGKAPDECAVVFVARRRSIELCRVIDLMPEMSCTHAASGRGAAAEWLRLPV